MGAYEFDLRTIVPADWFLGYGLNPDDPHVIEGNPDQDPYTTYEEWVADTDPTDEMSYFHIESISIASPVTVYFQSSSNRIYTLYGTAHLPAVEWNAVPGQIDIPGSGGLDALTDTADGPRKYYKLQVNTPSDD
jgi:hypothetical protein